MGRKTVRVEKLEPGLKLASAVVTVSGQRLLPSGAVLDHENISLLKKAGIRYVQIFEASYEESIDATVFKDILKNLDGKDAQAPGAAPASPAPPATEPVSEKSASSDEKIVKIKKVAADFRSKFEEEKKQMAQKFGEKYTTISYTIGEPRVRAAGEDAPFVDLLGLLARNMTDKLVFERRIDEDTLNLLTRDVISELSNRQNVVKLLTTAYSVSRYLLSHMVNVSLYSMRVAAEMQMTSTEITDVTVGAILHDIGMVLVPVGLWTSRKELAPNARDEVQQHTSLGAGLIRETPGTKEAWALPALEHHERLNGAGYPQGKHDTELSVASRIVQICDVYEAMTSDRSYRYARFPDVSMKHLLGAPAEYDRDIAQIFCKCMGFYPEGYSVKLSTGEQAVVVSSNPKNVFRPVIRLTTDKSGGAVSQEAQLELDLNNRLDLRIVEISNRRSSPVA